MDLIHTNADCVFDYHSKDKSDITETDPQVFEKVFKDVFKDFNPVNEEDEIEDINVIKKNSLNHSKWILKVKQLV